MTPEPEPPPEGAGALTASRSSSGARADRPPSRRRTVATLLIVIEVLGIASAMHAVMHVRTEQGTIAWAVSLVAMPYLAVPAYWIFGSSRFEGYVTARRGDLRQVAGITDQALAATRAHVVPSDSTRVATQVAADLAGLPLIRGNEVELLVDGEATFASILDGIAGARDYVLVQFYIVRDDEIGRALQSLRDLIEISSRSGSRS